MTSDEGRPCQHCIKREIGHLYHDEQRPSKTGGKQSSDVVPAASSNSVDPARSMTREKFHDPEVHDDKCPCEEHNYECDYSYVRSDGKCVPSGPEHIPNTQCTLGTPGEKYMGSSGYRKIPGNKGSGGSVSHASFAAEPVEGAIVHQIHPFPSDIVQREYFKGSKTVLI
ncbi:hypothetical protein EDD22DRAFT_952284 [Suillus occidentalis]|nr:hypothetical protein EDD22DRAFT_952284 [Suillus occidentalis]